MSISGAWEKHCSGEWKERKNIIRKREEGKRNEKGKEGKRNGKGRRIEFCLLVGPGQSIVVVYGKKGR